jgi:uncharacterized cupredoxin-like copper-binding protein
MTRHRATAGVSISALAFMVAATLGGAALAQTPPASAAPTTGGTAGPCPMSSASPGMMGDDNGMMGSGQSASPGMMGDDNGMMGSGQSARPGMMGDDHGMMGSGQSARPGMMGDSAGPDPCAAVQGIRIAVTLSDMMRIETAAMTVPVGAPVTFVVTNAGAVRHEFVLGDAAAQQAHEVAMQGMGGMMAADDPEAIALDPGVTKDLTWTFTQPGEMLAGCHVAGHYSAGMKAVITVTP